MAREILDEKTAVAAAQGAAVIMSRNMSREHMADKVYLDAVIRYITLWSEAKGAAAERFKCADGQIFNFKPGCQDWAMMLERKDELRKTAIPEAQEYIKEGLKNPYKS